MDVIKAHGTGNDFVVVLDLDDTWTPTDRLVTALCDRRTGIGADGVIRIGAPRDGGDVFMDYRNADGTVVQTCGNGIRVVAKTVVDRGLVAARDGHLAIGTRAGVKATEVTRTADGTVAEVTVDMGPPQGAAEDIPVAVDDPRSFTLDIAEGLTWAAVSMGNPHVLTRVDDLAAAPVTALGPQVERHVAFPQATNVGFAHVRARDLVDLRVWERGVGETRACGSGACAALVLLRADGVVDDEVTVRLPGGDLQVRYAPDRHPSVWLTGAAEEVATATLTPAWRSVHDG